MILADVRGFLVSRLARRFLLPDLVARAPALLPFALTLLDDLSDLATTQSSNLAQAHPDNALAFNLFSTA